MKDKQQEINLDIKYGRYLSVYNAKPRVVKLLSKERYEGKSKIMIEVYSLTFNNYRPQSSWFVLGHISENVWHRL